MEIVPGVCEVLDRTVRLSFQMMEHTGVYVLYSQIMLVPVSAAVSL